MRNLPRVYHGPIKEGFYVYSTSSCGDDCAIRLEYVETPDQCASFSFDSNFARLLGKMLIKVAEDYDNGYQTGID